MGKRPPVRYKRRFWKWRRKNFNYVLPFPGAQWGTWVLKEDRRDYIEGVLRKYSMVVKLADIAHELPELTTRRVIQPLSAEGRGAYDSMRKNFIYTSDRGNCYAPSAGVQALKLTELASGLVRYEDKTWECVDHWKYEKTAEICSRLVSEGRKVLVWVAFRPQYDLVAQHMQVPFVTVPGGITSKARNSLLKEFKGDTNVLVSHPQALGVGNNLQHASAMLYVSRRYSLEQDIQSKGRAYRKGSEQHEQVTRYLLMSQNTVDLRIDEALDNKWSRVEWMMRFADE